MDWLYLFYFALGTLAFFGARYAGRGRWNGEYTSLEQTKALQGIAALGIALHHMAQKTCAPWLSPRHIVHGLDPFIPIGYLLVGVFLFCSGMGLYKSLRSKPDYLKGFFRRRILPVVIAYYLSEFLYTGVRLLMGQKMDAVTILWYLSGLHLANANAWYAVAIPFFYLAFWAAFRLCRRDGPAIFLVFLFALGYTVLGALIDHQSDWWMQGEWWYNSILLFPLGLLFGRFEQRITAVLKKGYWFWLALALAAAVLLFQQSEWLNGNAWGYYGEQFDRLKVQHRLMSAGLQWLAALAFVSCCFLLLLKVRLGNRALASLGGLTLDFYLVHGLFVELFGFNFLDTVKSLHYIRSVPLYIAAVLGCSVPAALLFRLLRRKLTAWLQKKPGPVRERRAAKAAAVLSGLRRIRRFLLPVLVALTLLAFLLPSLRSGNENLREMNGVSFTIPDGFTREYTDSRYAVWSYAGKDRKPGRLILDGDIRDGKGRNFSRAEEVLAECDWMTEAELYVNPQGVRMVRGFASYSGSPERRYYIESAGSVLLLCMLEDERYYSPADCEAAILQAADSARRVR